LQTHSNQKEVPLQEESVSVAYKKKKNLRKFVAAKKQKNALADSFNSVWFWKDLKTPSLCGQVLETQVPLWGIQLLINSPGK